MERLNELYNGRLVFLTNSMGEKTDREPVPDLPYEWYENLVLPTDALLYLVRLDDVCGVLGIYEFGEEFCSMKFRGDMPMMHDHLERKCSELELELAQYSPDIPVLFGKESGFDECDEIAVFVQMGMNHEVIEKVFADADRICVGD